MSEKGRRVESLRQRIAASQARYADARARTHCLTAETAELCVASLLARATREYRRQRAIEAYNLSWLYRRGYVMFTAEGLRLTRPPEEVADE